MIDRIIYTQPDGSVAVIIPSGDIPTDEVMIKDVPATATNVRAATIADLPQDRLFRSAWDDSNPEDFVGINLVKAKIIAHDMRRIDRETKLTPLDNEERFIITAQTRRDAILIEKQVIIDANSITQANIDIASNEEELRIIINNW